MCDLCIDHDRKAAQFRRALSHVFDATSRDRISEALRDIESRKPQCTDIAPPIGKEQAVVDFQSHRVSRALDALPVPEIRMLVAEIEAALKPEEE